MPNHLRDLAPSPRHVRRALSEVCVTIELSLSQLITEDAGCAHVAQVYAHVAKHFVSCCLSDTLPHSCSDSGAGTGALALGQQKGVSTVDRFWA